MQAGLAARFPKNPSGRELFGLAVERLPDALKIYKVTQNVQLRNVGPQEVQSVMQVLAMIFCLAGAVIVECSQTTISPAIRVEHEQHSVGAVQMHGAANLLQDKLPVGLRVFPGQTPGPSGNAYRIKRIDVEPLDQLAQRLLKTMVEAPDNCGIALVAFPWRFEMENLANGRTSLRRDYYSWRISDLFVK